METPSDPTPRLQPDDKQVLVKVAGLLTWLTGLLVLVVAVTAYLLVFPPPPATPGAAAPASAPMATKNQIKIQTVNYLAPDRFRPDSVPPSPEGELIRYGRELIAHTPQYLGPQAREPRLRLAGSNLACQNCHLQAGQKAFAAPYVGVWGIYPTYKGRENAISTLEERINGCMSRSLNGRPLPLSGREMKAMVLYMKWLGRRVPVGEKVQGQGFVKFTMPDRAADLSQGQLVFARQCASCHGAGGQGQRPGPGPQYQYPPLWGPDSYNDGAGMHRLQTAARFIKANMPFGATAEHPLLSDAAAYDVAAYINSMPRPHLAHLEKDYPDLRKKPVDCPYPPYADQFSQRQHQLGPFAAMSRGRKGGE